MARRRKPKSPEQIAMDNARRRAEEREANARSEFGVNVDALDLQANGNVIVIMDSREAKKVQTARRDDVFDRLLNNEQYRAVRRLETDIAEQMGHQWRPGQRVTVDTSQYPPGQNVSQHQLDAGKRVDLAISLAGYRCGKLLTSLIIGIAGKDRSDWRGIVEHVTRETNEQAQGARVRAAADNLSDAYRTLDGPQQIKLKGT